MKFLVTGGFGYIGSHMCKLLTNKGYEVIVIDEVGPTHSYFTYCYNVNIGNAPQIRFILRKHKDIDGVFNFAAHSIVSESEKNPMKYYLNNVNETIVFLNELIEAKIKVIISSSTAAVYGNHKDKFDEDDLTQPINTYGKTKLIVEQILRDLSSKGLIKVGLLRYFNVAGNCPFNSIGENHSPETHIIPKIIQEIISGRNEVEIYGGDYRTIDGTCVRDYIHVEDLVQAHLLTFSRMVSDKSHKFNIFNVGNGEGYTNKQVLEMIKDVSEIDFKIKITDRRAGDPECLVANIDKIKFSSSFKPKYNLREMVKHTFSYQMEKFNENLNHGIQS